MINITRITNNRRIQRIFLIVILTFLLFYIYVHIHTFFFDGKYIGINCYRIQYEATVNRISDSSYEQVKCDPTIFL